MKRFLILATPVLAMTLWASAAPAVVIISNLPGNDGTDTTFTNVGGSKGMGFTMGADAYSLDSAELRLDIRNAPNTQLALALYDNDVANNPGSVLVEFTNPALSNGLDTLPLHANLSVHAGSVHDLLAGPFQDWRRRVHMDGEQPVHCADRARGRPLRGTGGAHDPADARFQFP
jgi:hypothetical protein